MYLRPIYSALGLICFLAAPVFTGCAHRYKMQLDASARPDALSRISYRVRDLSPGAEAAPAAHEAAVNYVRTALSGKGLYEAVPGEVADIDVAFGYEMNVQRRPKFERVPIYGAPIEDHPAVDGYIEQRTFVVTFEKQLHIVATETKPSKPGAPLRVWDISVSYEEKNADMIKAMPLLAAAVCDRIGTNTDGPIIVRLRDKDEVVTFIKRGL